MIHGGLFESNLIRAIVNRPHRDGPGEITESATAPARGRQAATTSPLSPELSGRSLSAVLLGYAFISTALELGHFDGRSLAHPGLWLGATFALFGGVLWFLPWHRWPPGATLKLVPLLLVLVSLHGPFGGAHPGIQEIFYLATFVWMGLAHPPGTCLRYSVLLAASNVAALSVTERDLVAGLAGTIAPFLTCLGVGELLARLNDRSCKAQRSLGRMVESYRLREARYRSLVQNSSDVITIVDRDRRIRYQGGSVMQVLGYGGTERLGQRLEEWAHHEDGVDVLDFFARVLQVPASTASVECRLLHADGSWRYCTTSAINLLHDSNVAGVVLSTRDITEHQALADQLSFQAFHDPLTGLANRALFIDRVEHALQQGFRFASPVAVLFLDLDGFKTINDSLGHEAGDRLLVSVAQRLESCLRAGDTVARLGGDEFAILIEQMLVGGDAEGMAVRLLEALRPPFEVQGREVVVRCSIGIAVTTCGADATDDLLRNADLAMYVAKANGKNSYAVFQPQMHAEILTRLELQTDLHGALERQEFTIHFQPTVELQTARIVGMEALLRWNHPQRGLLHPASFIPLAEETGLIVPLGAWVLHQSCLQARAWQEIHPVDPPLMISVNLSALQLQNVELCDSVQRALQDSGLNPRHLVLEITETMLVSETSTLLENIQKLRDMGVRLALDDFGTGYSSLNYIRQFNIEILKIDKAFLPKSDDVPGNRSIARAIVNLGHALGLQMVAEGVENARQMELLRSLGCHLGQGYHFAAPLTTEAMDDLLSRPPSGDPAWQSHSLQRGPGTLWEEFCRTAAVA